jgi:hypothetical protein
MMFEQRHFSCSRKRGVSALALRVVVRSHVEFQS